MLTYEQITTPITKEQALDDLLEELEALGFNVTAWQTGSVQRLFVTIFAIVYSRLSSFIAFMAKMAFNATSEGSALTLFSDSHYDNQRVVEVATVGNMTFTGGATGPPYTVVAGDIVVKDQTSGQTFRNITGGTIPNSGTLELSMQCQTPGIVGNIANNSTLTLQTSLAGVTVTNPPGSSGTWITTQGVDEEADATLRTRNTTKWATLNFAAPKEAYINLALEADTDITRVAVDDSNPGGPGTVDVYIARANGVATSGSSSDDVETVQAYLAKKRPTTADPVVKAAPAQAVTVSGTIHITASLNTAAKQAEIEAAVLTYVNSLDIGGEDFGSGGVLPFSELVGAITAVEGVRRVSLTSPTADVAISGFSIATVNGGAPSFSYSSF